MKPKKAPLILITLLLSVIISGTTPFALSETELTLIVAWAILVALTCTRKEAVFLVILGSFLFIVADRYYDWNGNPQVLNVGEGPIHFSIEVWQNYKKALGYIPFVVIIALVVGYIKELLLRKLEGFH